MIDLGWYPEFDEKGKFVLQLINNGNCEKPIYKKKSRKWTHIRKALLKAIDIAHEF